MKCKFCEGKTEQYGIHDGDGTISMMYKCVDCNRITYTEQFENMNTDILPPIDMEEDIFDLLHRSYDQLYAYISTWYNRVWG